MESGLKHIFKSVKSLKVPGYKICTSPTSPASPISPVSPTPTLAPFVNETSKAAKIEREFAKFWKRLELTMPKKKKHCSAVDENSTEMNSVRSNTTEEVDIKDIASNIDISHESKFIEIDLTDSQKYGTMSDYKSNPLSIYQISPISVSSSCYFVNNEIANQDLNSIINVRF